MRTLEHLLDPLKVSTFLDDVWGVDHYLVSRQSPDYFADLFSPADLEQFLAHTRPDDATIRLARKGDRRHLSELRLANGSLDLVRIRNDFADGYTIVLNGLEWFAPPVAEVARAIEADLNFETQVNAYVTPPLSQGFLPHYDDHDVLVLQVSGSKLWHLYDGYPDVAPRELQLRESFIVDALPAPTDLRVSAGDTLYVPRGRVHAAEATDEPSLHLTFGIHPPTIRSLLLQAVDALDRRDDRVSTRLPPRYLEDPDARRRLGDLVRDLAPALAAPAVVDEAVGAVEDALVRRGRAGPTGHLLDDVVALGHLHAGSVVEKNRPLYSRVLSLGGGVALQFGQSLISAGADHRDALLFVSRNTEPFRVADIPGLAPAAQVALARKLVVDGFLVLLAGE